jgi:AcrR family transcriptional regulator
VLQTGGLARDSTSPPGLRVRKKERTRAAIREAALELFVERGYEATTVDAIAATAEVSTTTFFRYFSSKEDVIFSDRHAWQPALRQAIVNRPAMEGDLVAVRAAMEEAWARSTDPEIVARRYRAIATSSVLRGRGTDVVAELEATISEALAERRGMTMPERSCRFTAFIAVMVLGRAVAAWANEGCSDSLEDAIHHSFELLTELAAEWSVEEGQPVERGGRLPADTSALRCGSA